VVVVANARIPGERAQSIQTVRTAAAFARAGCQVTLLYARRRVQHAVAGAAGDPLAYYGVREAVELVAVPVLDFIDAVPRRFQYLPARLEEWTFGRNAARQALRQGDALVHCREIEAGAVLGRRRHPAYLFEAHSIPRNPVKRRWLARALEGALGVVAITRGLSEDLTRELGTDPASILVSPDAHDPAALERAPSKEEARRSLGLDPGRPTVVYTGHLFAWKGVDTLVEAARTLPETAFVLVGGLPVDIGRMRAVVSSLGLRNVEVRGHRPPTEIPAYLAAADVVAVPNSGREAISARHTSPLKLFEAMAAGKAVVASDLPSLREVLTHGVNAWLVDPDDPDALAKGIARLAGDPALAASLASRAREDARGFTFDARARALLEFAAARRVARHP
jgi:glycosyltransferase involved in cell wall biosynthesis